MAEELAFGRWLKARRKALDVTQEALSERVGCAVDTLRRVEAERLRPSRELAERLAEQLALDEAETERFVQAARQVRSVTPAAASASAPALPHRRLPVPLTPLIGRAAEVATVSRLLHQDTVRLLTLTGPGGIGKTRLALQVGGEVLHAFRDGVWFVDLAPLTDPEQVASAIAATLGVKDAGGQPVLERLTTFLQGKHLLLLLDNFEQLVAAAPIVADLLRAAPQLTVLVTSRVVLHLYGEHEYPVPPLTLPDPQQRVSLETLSQYEAVTLFIQRALAVKPDFHVTNETAPAVAEICVRLDGLPLAIELAAARIKLFAPQALLARLEQRLKTLTGGARDLPARHQTLRAALDWSYHLLTADEQHLFARLGVFVGGWMLEAVTAVCMDAGTVQDDVLDVLASLVEQSLVRQQDEDEPRFVMLETIREYALEWLIASGDLDALQQQHAEYYLALAEALAPQLTGPEQMQWLDRLAAEQSNLRAAMTWSWAAGGSPELGARGIAALWRFWYYRGHFAEWDRWLLAMRTAGRELPPAAVATALVGRGIRALNESDFELAVALGEESLALSRLVGDRWGSAAALILTGAEGEPPGTPERVAEGLALARAVGEPWLLAWALYNQGMVLGWVQRETPQATAVLEESLVAARAVGDKWLISAVLTRLAQLARSAGLARATALAEEALTIQRLLGDTLGVSRSLRTLSEIAVVQGDVARARELNEHRLRLEQALGNKNGIADALVWVGAMARIQGDYTEAQRLLERALALLPPTAERQLYPWILNELGLVALAGGQHAEATTYLRESLAVYRELERCEWETARALGDSAAVAGASGQGERAARLLGAAEAAREAYAVRLPPPLQAELERAVAATRALVDKRAFAAAWAAGRTLTLELAIAYALDHNPVPAAPASMRPTARDADLAPTTGADSSNTDPTSLTGREREVLRRVAQGLRTGEVAAELGLSPLTVTVHLRAIYRKLGVRSRTAATRLAIEQHLV